MDADAPFRDTSVGDPLLDGLDALQPLGERVIIDDRIDSLVERIAAQVKPADHVLIMSNGGFGGLHQKLLRRISGES